MVTPLIDGPVRVLGAAELEPTPDGIVVHRLPARSRVQLPDDFARMVEEQPAGVRLAFRTAASRVELDVRAFRSGARAAGCLRARSGPRARRAPA